MRIINLAGNWLYKITIHHMFSLVLNVGLIYSVKRRDISLKFIMRTTS